MTEYFMPISELAKKLDIPAHTLRYWEKEFPSLIVPTTGAGGRRYYRQETVDNLGALKKYLYADGYTIDGVKKLIATGEFAKADVEQSKQYTENHEHHYPAPAAHPFASEGDFPQYHAAAHPSIREGDLQAAIDLLKDAKKILAKN